MLVLLGLALLVFYLMSDREDAIVETADNEPWVWNREAYDNGDFR